jgi:RimJ/RimL family protein N-acetyltransferase
LTNYIAEQKREGLSKWKVSLHEGTFVGRAGWSRWGKEELELGYAIKPDFQGRGYALEASRSLIAWARMNRPERLVGFAPLANSASRHILARSGMIYEDDRLINGVIHAFYTAPR